MLMNWNVCACVFCLWERAGGLLLFFSSSVNKDESLKFHIQTKLNVKVQHFTPLLRPTFSSVADK